MFDAMSNEGGAGGGGGGGGGGEGVVAAQTSPPLTAVERKTNGCGRGWKASGESPRWAAPNLHFPHPTTRAVTGGHRRVDLGFTKTFINSI